LLTRKYIRMAVLELTYDNYAFFAHILAAVNDCVRIF
jgi:hypothetical protein